MFFFDITGGIRIGLCMRNMVTELYMLLLAAWMKEWLVF